MKMNSKRLLKTLNKLNALSWELEKVYNDDLTFINPETNDTIEVTISKNGTWIKIHNEVMLGTYINSVDILCILKVCKAYEKAYKDSIVYG